MHDIITVLTQPARVWSRAEVLQRPCPVPRAKGVYAWFFKEYPAIISTAGCIQHNGMTLLYVGISPRAPTIAGRIADPQVSSPIQKMNLRTRIRQHYSLNAEGSTLRLSLGVLLEEELGIQLRRVGSGKRKTFTRTGEAALSQWMAENAFVTWLPHEAPWVIEEELIATLSLPLNLDQNRAHSFAPVLSAMRSAAKRRAEALPVV